MALKNMIYFFRFLFVLFGLREQRSEFKEISLANKKAYVERSIRILQ